MDDQRVIKHPLDRFAFSGTVGALDREGRESLESLMLLIGDMRFRSGTVEGTCARYFLLVDPTWVPKLCYSAHINCAKLREHLSHSEYEQAGASDLVPDVAQSSLPFTDDVAQPRTIPSGARAPRYKASKMSRLMTAAEVVSPELQPKFQAAPLVPAGPQSTTAERVPSPSAKRFAGRRI
ncbi:MAG TPA: hypothetical protein VJO53_07790 [Candidatus Acidoferrales bacterium]|nr:hypothetical protein [Candidatus Acidoferrales bacterium]